MKLAIVAGGAWMLAAAAAAGIAQEPPFPVYDAQTRAALVVVYGNDPCPAGTDDEIIVCARRPDADRFRIPEPFRENPQRRVQESWVMQADRLEYVGRTGIQSCSPAGPGGFTGCWEEMMRQAREDRAVNPEGQPVP